MIFMLFSIPTFWGWGLGLGLGLGLGHGALTIGLKNTDKYSSISGFAPICSPIQCPWGQKALGHYLGADESTWSEYDSCALLNNMASDCLIPPLLVDQGEADEFLETQLNLGLLQQALKGKDCDATVRLQPGYDHSYFFIASFIEDHINFHAKHLKDQN